MSNGGDNKSSCFICLHNEQPTVKATRNAKKVFWICCDTCNRWFHACCGGYTINQYHKINKENIWIKCAVCCLSQIHLIDCEGDGNSRNVCIEEAVKSRVSEVTSNKGSKKRKKSDQSKTVCSVAVSPGEGQQSISPNSVPLCRGDVSSYFGQHSELDGASDNLPDAIDTLHNVSHQDSKVVTVSCESDIDKVLIIDDIDNVEEYKSSRRILKEIHNYFPEVKVDYAYSLAKGGVAIHTTSKSDRDLLENNLPEESFGRGVRHPPKGQGGTFAFIKRVDTSVDVQSLSDYLRKQGVCISEVRRLTKRDTGKPTQVVKVKADAVSVDILLRIKLIINGRLCTVERPRAVNVIRCFNCQRFGHLAKHCTGTRQCATCGDSHDTEQQCSTQIFCVNCSGSHPAYSSSCPVFRDRYALLAV